MKGWNFYLALLVFFIGLVIYSLITNIKQQVSLAPQIIVYPEPVYNVFWTGGYDSTFLVVYFLKFGNVQPVYLKGDAFVRKSKDKEIQTMDAIRKSIHSRYKLLPTIYVNNQLLDQDILDAEQEAKEFYDGKKLSTVLQYTYMSQYCKDNNFIGHVAAVNSGNYWQKLPVIDKGTTRCRNTTLRLFKNFRFNFK
jgi:hypothetical protein